MGTSWQDPLPVVLERDYARVETLFAFLVTAVDYGFSHEIKILP